MATTSLASPSVGCLFYSPTALSLSKVQSHAPIQRAVLPSSFSQRREANVGLNLKAAQSDLLGRQLAQQERRQVLRSSGTQLSETHNFRPSRSDILRKGAAAGAIVAMASGEGTPIVLVHGFGASAFHWRYNIPELAKKHKVFAIDLLGFGWSDKALVDYNAALWRDQVADFIREKAGGQPVVLAGNSIGGFTVLSTAAKYPELVKGLVLLNVAGKFADKDEKPPVLSDSVVTKELEDVDVDDLKAVQEPEGALQQLMAPVKELVQRGGLLFAFYQARSPDRIKSVLQQVYINKTNVDDYLVESISQPAFGPNAAEVYYRLVTQVMLGPGATTIDKLLTRLKMPLLLLWGDLDPWMGPSKAARIQELYPKADRVSLQSGHCPHDESPEETNKALLEWMSKLEA